MNSISMGEVLGGVLPMIFLYFVFQVMAIVTALVVWERFFRRT